MIKLTSILSEVTKTKKEGKETKKPTVEEKIKSIEERGNLAALEAKMGACEEEIQERARKLAAIDEVEGIEELVNPTRVNEIKKEIKELSKAKEKYQKMHEKLSKGSSKKEMVDEKNNVE